MENQILTALIGSQAHGLATPTSDYDWRGVFITPTSQLLSLGGSTGEVRWIEGQEDDVSWELSKFLFLSTKCNPSVLEVYMSPQIKTNEWGEELLALFPHIWNSKGVRDAFTGYGRNQRKKFLEDKDQRSAKYAVAYLRTLYCAYQLLTTGTFDLRITDPIIFDTCKLWRLGQYTVGGVIDSCVYWEQNVERAYQANPNKQTDLAPVNDFLLRARKAHW